MFSKTTEPQIQGREAFAPSHPYWETPENAAAMEILLEAKASGLGILERGDLIVRLQSEINQLADSIEGQHRAMGHPIEKAHAYLLACERWLLRRAQGAEPNRARLGN